MSYGKFMSPTKIKHVDIHVVPDAALKQKNVCLLVAFLRRTVQFGLIYRDDR